ncbi:hypothetical protein GFH48_18985 [Streptomyces fagopyri]|uniref:Uncharacterized protein n=1 Tax=Streptomyces fagopyri TaxID=2662397 RepID=A0A5Q0LE04_9ACTN|nr:hypothetical protein [Streptomyces fagopyri]QFZ75074.1 hypothetical protein GFH48_18985 [Streptomyces fagopyri]
MTAWERFNNRVLSITPAEPGWQVHVEHRTVTPTESRVDEEHLYPVVTWALVESEGRSGETSTHVEPVFYDESALRNATEYRRIFSDPAPAPGEPKLLVHIELRQP